MSTQVQPPYSSHHTIGQGPDEDEDEQDSDNASLTPDNDHYDDFAARDAKAAKLRSLKEMDTAETDYLSASKAYNDEIQKPKEDALASISFVLD